MPICVRILESPFQSYKMALNEAITLIYRGNLGCPNRFCRRSGQSLPKLSKLKANTRLSRSWEKRPSSVKE